MPWKILLVDDEIDVHTMTEIALKDIKIYGRSLVFENAMSAASAKEILSREQCFCVALIDVVMESDDAGLGLVKYIREELNDHKIRLIIRTGQPGIAPERYVIDNYDIDDYKDKTELVVQKLYTTIRTAIKSYRDIITIERNRLGLEKILEASPELYRIKPLEKFYEGSLIQVASMCNVGRNSLITTVNSFLTANNENCNFKFYTGTGKYKNKIDQTLINQLTKLIESDLLTNKPILFNKANLIIPIKIDNTIRAFIYLEDVGELNIDDKKLLNIMANQCTAALENLILYNELEGKKELELTKNLLAEKVNMLETIYSAAQNTSLILTDASSTVPIITKISPGTERMFGYKEDELLGKNYDILLARGALSEDFSEFIAKVENKTINELKKEVVQIKKTGEHLHTHLRLNPIFDSNNKIKEILWVSFDISEQKKIEKHIKSSNKKLSDLVLYDSLTGLINRRPFIDLLDKNISRTKREKEKLALLFLDLEKFKEINDIYGHATGDKVLLAATKKIEKNIRTSDIAGRLGGDEFIVCLNNINSLAGATRVAKQINKAFLEKIKINDFTLDLGVSIGIAIYPNDGENAIDLLKNSDLAMYKSKKQRKNSFHVFNIKLKNELFFSQKLQEALKKNELKVNYQTIFDKNLQLYCLEALLRWESPEFGTVLPMDFIPLLENDRSIVEVGEWVFREVCSKLKAYNDLNLKQNICISTNISQYQMNDKFFVSKIKNIIEETNINPDNIIIEITEKFQIKDTEQVNNVLKKLKEIGIGLIGLDDFGSGYSSFSNLLRFPLNIVKIDNFFAQRLDVEKYRKVTLDLITLMKNYDLKIIAEGVETKEQFECLAQMGCDYFQGFYFSIPQKNIISALKKCT